MNKTPANLQFPPGRLDPKALSEERPLAKATDELSNELDGLSEQIRELEKAFTPVLRPPCPVGEFPKAAEASGAPLLSFLNEKIAVIFDCRAFIRDILERNIA